MQEKFVSEKDFHELLSYGYKSEKEKGVEFIEDGNTRIIKVPRMSYENDKQERAK